MKRPKWHGLLLWSSHMCCCYGVVTCAVAMV